MHPLLGFGCVCISNALFSLIGMALVDANGVMVHKNHGGYVFYIMYSEESIFYILHNFIKNTNLYMTSFFFYCDKH